MSNIKIYSAKFRCNSSLFTAFKESISSAVSYKDQIILAIRKEIEGIYKQDVFGLFWSIAMPVLPMTVYMILAHIKVFNTSSAMPFIFYIAVGMMVWLLMSTTINSVMMSIKKEAAILKTTNYPIFIAMLSQLGIVMFETVIRLIAVALIIIWFKIEIGLTNIPYTLLALVSVTIFSFAVGMILSILDILVQDTRRVVDIFLRYGLFVSSVIFPFPTEGILGFLNKFNFFNTYINTIRDFLFFGHTDILSTFIYTSIVGVILFLIATKLIYSLDYKVRAYL
jgi:lipopolysaccharide transport system permease protein